MKRYKIIVLGILILCSPVFAGSIIEKIEVSRNSINLLVDNQKVDVDNFIYNGTTYIPLRKTAEILDKAIEFNGSTKTISIRDNNELSIATIEMKSGEKIKLELYRDEAPITVDNFIKLANDGFYNGLIFHRVIPDFVIQGGDPNGDGTGGSENNINGEFMKNSVSNSLLHTRGVISMARSKDYNSASSQFFIVLKDSPHLNGEYAAFGRVIEGMEFVDNIASVETKDDKPVVDQVIKNIIIE